MRGKMRRPSGDCAMRMPRDLVRRQLGDVGAGEGDRAGAGARAAEDRHHQRRLAGAVGADQRDDLAFVDGDVDAVQRADVAVIGLDALDAGAGLLPTPSAPPLFAASAFAWPIQSSRAMRPSNQIGLGRLDVGFGPAAIWSKWKMPCSLASLVDRPMPLIGVRLPACAARARAFERGCDGRPARPSRRSRETVTRLAVLVAVVDRVR